MTAGVDDVQTEWTRVERLDTDAILVVAGEGADFIYAGSDDPARRVAKLSTDDGMQHRVGVAVDGLGFVYVSDGERILRLDRRGTVDEIARLRDCRRPDGAPLPAGARITWHLSAGQAGRFYFALLGDTAGERGFAELESSRGEIAILPFGFPSGVDVDASTRLAFCAEQRRDARGTLLVGDFATGEVTRLSLRATTHHRVALAPDKRRLVLSAAASFSGPEPTLELFDLGTRVAWPTTVHGTNAAWLDDETVLYCRGENELWRWSLATHETDRLFVAGPSRGKTTGSFAKPPTVSRSGRFFAAAFAVDCGEGPDRPRMQTVLFDTERKEWSVIERWCRDVAWLE